MNLSFVRKHRFPIVVGVVAVAMVLVAGVGDLAVASNMGFKMNRQILVGNNLISLPFKTPVATAKDLCNVFGKTTAATSLTQFTGAASQSFTCDQGTAGFPITAKGIGVLIKETGSAATGILVGSHIPGQSVTIPDAGTFPVGTILYGYPYHSTNVNARDLCQDLGLSTTVPVSVVRFAGAASSAYSCDQTASAGFPLVLGEAVLIQNEQNGPKVAVPSHF